MNIKDIRGYWHICMMNHWYSVCVEQLRILLTSGLYDACTEISIGCVGPVQERELLMRYIVQPHPKLKVRYYCAKFNVYEFPTLQLIENDAGDYIGFYFHTKAVTKPFDTVYNHWRVCLNEMVLNRWKDHWLNISSGIYDISGLNFLGPPKHPEHYSGNFWWFHRQYIDRLPKVKSLNQRNRFLAEQWICKTPNKRLFSNKFVEPADLIFDLKYTKQKL